MFGVFILKQKATSSLPCRHTSKLVCHDVIQFVCSQPEANDVSNKPPNRCCEIMRNLVQDALRERAAFMQELLDRLEIQVMRILTQLLVLDTFFFVVNCIFFKSEEDLLSLHLLTDEIFRDEPVSWGKMVVLIAFACCLAKLVFPHKYDVS